MVTILLKLKPQAALIALVRAERHVSLELCFPLTSHDQARRVVRVPCPSAVIVTAIVPAFLHEIYVMRESPQVSMAGYARVPNLGYPMPCRYAERAMVYQSL